MNIENGNFELELGYTFRNKELLNLALTHRSYGNENKKYKNRNNEKLELLGDSILNFVVSEYLFIKYSNLKEGDLAKLKSMAVSEPVLAKVSKKLNIGAYLILGKGEDVTGGRQRNSLLGDAFEALLAAVYLDSNFEIAKEIALLHLQNEIDTVEENDELLDYKTLLQELIQKKYKIVPKYELINEIGESHKKIFEVGVFIFDKELNIKKNQLGFGIGSSKKKSEQKAAKVAYIRLKNNERAIDETL